MKEVEEEKIGEIEPGDLLADLAQCYESCIDGIAHCLEQGGDFAEKDHIVILWDCADICKLAETSIIRESEYAGDFLNLCALICDDCAQACDKFFNDKHMSTCAEVCRNCADSCREAISEEELEAAEEEEKKRPEEQV